MLKETFNRTRSVSIAMLTAALCISLPLTGCTPTQEAQTQKEVASLTQTLTTAVANVAKLEGNPTLAAQLTADGAAAVTAVTNWQNGSAVSDVIEALGIVEDDLNLIPIADQYAPLIDLAIGTVQTLLSLIPPSAVTPAVASTLQAHRVKSRVVFLGHPAPHTKKDFVKQWNALIKTNPRLANAPPIK